VKLVDRPRRQIWFVLLKARDFNSDSVSVQRSSNRNGDAGGGSQDENRAWIPTASHLTAVVVVIAAVFDGLLAHASGGKSLRTENRLRPTVPHVGHCWAFTYSQL
jgi:hypothetical protein